MPTWKQDLHELSGNQLSELTGFDRRRVSKTLRGVDPVRVDGKTKYYDPREALPLLYHVHTEPSAEGVVLNLDQERAWRERRTREKLEIELRRSRGELVEVRLAAFMLEQIIAACRAHLLALPTKLAPLVLGAKTLRQCKAKLEAGVDEALHELSRINVAQLGAAGEGGDVGAPAEADGERLGRSRKSAQRRGQRRARKMDDGKGAVPARHHGRRKQSRV